MSLVKLILSEIRFRSTHFLLSLLAISLAATMFVAGPTIMAGYQAETSELLADRQQQIEAELAELDKKTKRIMRDLGVNLRIVHEDTNMGDLYTDFQAHPFPEDWTYKLAEAPSIETIVHLVATLQHKTVWQDRAILLVGMKPVLTNSQKNEEKPHMVKPVEPGTAVVGHYLGIGRKPGDTIELDGHSFTIASIQPEKGTQEDIQIVLDLDDAQRVAGLENQIHQIMALNCKCKGNRISKIRAELEGVLPNTRVTEHLTRATQREQQRDQVEQKNASLLAAEQADREQQEATISTIVNWLIPTLVLFAAILVGVMAMLNVRERRAEIGLLRALGKTTPNIASLFLGKSILMGILGGAAGCLLGYLIAIAIGQAVDIRLFYLRPQNWLIAATLVGAPVVAALSSYLPTLLAVSQDPAIVLMDEV